MKPKLFLLIAAALGLSVALSACATGLSPSSWSGLSADADKAYLANGSYVYAVNLKDGTQAWRFPKSGGGPFFTTPVLTPDGQQVIVGGFDNKLYSVNTADGSQKWVFDQARDRWIGAALVTSDTIYAPNSDYNLYALDLNGNPQWTFTADESLWSAPVTDGQSIYFGSLGRKLYAVDAKGGKQVWVKTLDGAVLGSPALGPNGSLYVDTYAGTVYALDTAKGNIQWQQKVSGNLWAGPVLNGSTLLLCDMNGTFYMLDAGTGKELNRQKLVGTVLGTPLVTGDGAVVATEGIQADGKYTGSVYFLDATGATLHNPTVSGKVYTSPVAAGSLILVAPMVSDATQPILIAYDASGTQKWPFVPQK